MLLELKMCGRKGVVKRDSSSILFQQSKQNIQFQHNKFNKARQPEGQMSIMLAIYSTNKVMSF